VPGVVRMRHTPVQSNAPERLAAVRRTALLDTPPEEAFDRLTRMAARLLGAPVAFISLLTEDRQFFKSATGLPEPWATRRNSPAAASFCRHVVDSRRPLVVDDARRDPLLRTTPAVRELGWIAYAGVPLITRQGYVVGTLGVVDVMPRLWSDRDQSLLQDLAASAVTEIELRSLQAATTPVQATDVLSEAAIPMGVASPDGRWIRVNPALADLLGASPGDLVGELVEAYTHPEDRASEREAERLLRAGECASYTSEKRCVRRSGEAVWVLATVTAVPAGDQTFRHLIIAMQDIGQRKQVEAALRESEARYRLAAQATDSLVRDWDLLTDRIVWGEGFERLFDDPAPGAVSAAWWYERIHPEDRERVVARIQHALSEGHRSREEEYRFRRSDGSWVRLADRISVVTDAAGEPVRVLGIMTDIGSRRDGEAALRGSEARYRSLVDNLREVVFRTDTAGRWELLNPAWEELTGFSIIESTGASFLDYVHPEDRAVSARAFERLLARRRTTHRSEVRYLTRDAGFRWVEVWARVALDERGEPVGTSGTITDITERKRAELLSSGQSRLLEEIAAGTPLSAVLDGIARFTEEHGSPGIATLMMPEGDGSTLRLASAPRLPASLKAGFGGVPVGPRNGTCGTAAFRRERVVVRDIANDPLWEGWPARDALLSAGIRACWSVPILSARGEVLGTFAVYYVDVREPGAEDFRIVEIASHLAKIAIERERTQAEIQRSTGLLQQVMETLPIGVWVTATDGRIIFGNPAGREIWGGGQFAHVEQFGEGRAWWADTGEPIEPRQWAAARVLKSGETTLNELVRIQTFDGRQKTIMSSAVPIRGAENEILGAIIVNQDVTERRAAEEALRRSEEQLRQAQKMEAVGQLAGGIAHDFNNLLTGVLTYCDLILQEVRQGDPIRSDVEQIRHAGQRAAGLTRQLLAFSRRQVLQPRVLSLNSTVTELDGMLRRLIRADINLETELDPALWYVLADPGQIEQVLVNLVVNARDAMPQGGRIGITTANRQYPSPGTERPTGVRPGSYVVLTVADTGQGMDPQIQARIFDPFFTTKEPGKGTGLGLSTVYGIVEQSGGHIRVESAPGRGAVFTIHLPRYEGTGAAVPSRGDRRTLPGGAETLLLVEDENAVRSSARRLLERHGYTVLEARHGADALRIVEEADREVDLVVTDLVMPEMGGREMVERLRTRRPALKVLFMSGYTEKAITTDGLMPPRTGFVEKPFTMEQLLRRLRELLDED
jgi:two-component system, cell cycle sensor histidine kinase and response regulator CckA